MRRVKLSRKSLLLRFLRNVSRLILTLLIDDLELLRTPLHIVLIIYALYPYLLLILWTSLNLLLLLHLLKVSLTRDRSYLGMCLLKNHLNLLKMLFLSNEVSLTLSCVWAGWVPRLRLLRLIAHIGLASLDNELLSVLLNVDSCVNGGRLTPDDDDFDGIVTAWDSLVLTRLMRVLFTHLLSSYLRLMWRSLSLSL
jgi:hypothetical protein